MRYRKTDIALKFFFLIVLFLLLLRLGLECFAPPNPSLPLTPGEIESCGEYCYSVSVDQSRLSEQLPSWRRIGGTWIWTSTVDFLPEGQKSSLSLYENGVPLTIPHASLEEIKSLGEGRFRLAGYGERVVSFSTSDNSDPRVNGREYSLSVSLVVRKRFALGVIAFSIIAAVFLLSGIPLFLGSDADLHKASGRLAPIFIGGRRGVKSFVRKFLHIIHNFVLMILKITRSIFLAFRAEGERIPLTVQKARFLTTALLILPVAHLVIVILALSDQGAENAVAFMGIFPNLIWPSSLLCLFGLLIIVGREWCCNLAISALTVSIGVLSLGAYLDASGRHHDQCTVQRIKAAQSFGVEYDTGTALDEVVELRRNGADAFPFFFPTNQYQVPADRPINDPNFVRVPSEVLYKRNGQDVFILAGGVSGATTVYANELGEWLSYETDEYGFHNKYGSHSSPADVVLIGDSYTHGCCVKSEENLAGVISRQGFKTINLGIGNTGPLLQYAALVEYAQALRPKIVFWVYYSNDMGNFQGELDQRIPANYFTPSYSQNLRALQPDIEQHLRAKLPLLWENYPSSSLEKLALGHYIARWWDIRSGFLKNITLVPDDSPNTTVPSSSKNDQETDTQYTVPHHVFQKYQNLLEQGKNLVSSWGGDMYLVVFSHDPDVKKVIRTAENAGIEVVHAYRDLDAARKVSHTEPYGACGHMNANGFSVVANTMMHFAGEHRVLK